MTSFKIICNFTIRILNQTIEKTMKNQTQNQLNGQTVFQN